jgi:hypothetical protein
LVEEGPSQSSRRTNPPPGQSPNLARVDARCRGTPRRVRTDAAPPIARDPRRHACPRLPSRAARCRCRANSARTERREWNRVLDAQLGDTRSSRRQASSTSVSSASSTSPGYALCGGPVRATAHSIRTWWAPPEPCDGSSSWLACSTPREPAPSSRRLPESPRSRSRLSIARPSARQAARPSQSGSVPRARRYRSRRPARR